jgi:serine/threonine protein kinase/Tfp pilus assembly protein PilF
LAELVEDLTVRLQAGEPVDLEGVLRGHPDQAADLRRLLPALGMLADLSRPAGSAAAPGDTPTPLGELGDYRLLREVGRGGMGVVYEAEQVSLSRRVALKVLPFAATLDPKQLQRFKNEAKAAASLKHEHIVQVYGVGCERGVHFYAMEYVEGQTLAQYIHALYHGGDQPAAAGGATQDYTPGAGAAPTAPVAALSTRHSSPRGREFYCTAARLIAQAADALEHAHSLGIVHRDVKPGNLIVDAAGKLWVTDFGLARFGPDAGLTVSGDLLGTLRYMAPEQALARHGLADHRADVYGLGCTLYELLTGRPAVDAADRAEILRRIAFEEPTAPRKLDRVIPAELETITLKALAKEPAHRYATAGELADDLRRWLSDQTIKAKPPTFGQRAAKWGRRHKYLARSAVAVLAVAAVALAVSTGLVLREKTRAEERFQAARAAVDDMYTRVAEDWLDDAPRLTDVQQQFLEKALGFYQRFGAEHAQDPAVRHEGARAFLRVGRIEAKLGRSAAAESAYREAIARVEALAAAFPQAADYRGSLGMAYRHLSELLRESTRLAESEQAALRAIDLQTRLVVEIPEWPGSWPELATSHNALGVTYMALGQRPDAEREYTQALEICERLAAAFPGSTAYQSSLGGTLHNLVVLHTGNDPDRVEGDAAEAERLLARAIRHQQAAIQTDPRRAKSRRHLAVHHRLMGDLLNRTNRFAEAAKAYADAAALQEKLLEDFPGVPEYRSTLADTRVSRADSLTRVGRHPEAIELLRSAQGLNRGLAREFPDTPKYDHALAQSLSRLGQAVLAVQAQKGPHGWDAAQLREAESAFREAITVLEGLAKRFPDEPGHQSQLGATLNNLAVLLSQRGDDPAEARAMVRRAIDLQRQALAARPHHPDYRRFLRNHYAEWAKDQERLAVRHVQAGRVGPAEQVYGQLRGQYERLVAEFRDQPVYLRDLSMVLSDWARLYSQLDPPELRRRALPLVEEAIRRQQTAVQARPRDLSFHATLIDHHFLLAETQLRLADPKAAEATYRRAVELARGVADEFPGAQDSRRFLAISQGRLGHLLMDPTVWHGERDGEAEPLLRASVEVWERLLKDYPGAPVYENGVAHALDELGLCLLMARKDQESVQPRRRVLVLAEQRFAKQPATVAGHADLGAQQCNLAEVLYVLGQLDEARGLLEKAVQNTQAALKADPDNAVCRKNLANHYWLLGHVAWRQGEWRAAREAFQNAVQLKQPNSNYYEGLAWMLANDPDPLLRDVPRAVELAKQAVKLHETSETAWQALGIANYRAGRWPEAVAALERAKSLDAEATDSFFLAMAHWQLGEKESARKLYTEGVAWLEANKPQDGQGRAHRLPVAEVRRFGAEAAALLGVADAPKPPENPAPKP